MSCQAPGSRSTAMEQDKFEDQRTDEGRRDRARAREDGDEDEPAGGGPISHLRIDMLNDERTERTADARQHAGDDELEMDQPVDRHAEELDANFVVTRRQRRLPATDWK